MMLGSSPSVASFDDPLDDFNTDDDLQELLDRLDIPEVRPGSLSESYAIVRSIPVPLFARRPGQSISEVLDALGAPKWLRDYYPHIEAYRAPPRSLRELQADVLTPKTGYDIHHIVERTPALGEGFPRSVVDGPENLVRISRFKHWEITAWFSRKNKNFGGLSPREYLRGKSWDERMRVGLMALIENGILRP